MDPRIPKQQAKYQDELIELLSQLVAIPSVNPGLDPAGQGESHLADFLQAWASSRGLSFRRIGEERPSVIIQNPDDRPGAPTVLFAGHLDTVGFGRMADPLDPRREGDRIYGRGAYDMKAGMAASLIALLELDKDHSVNAVVAMVADEEYGSRGMEETLPHLDVDYAIVPEMTELQIGVAHKGFVWLEVRVVGKAAHGSRPHLGADAILNAGHVLVALEALDAELRSRLHPLLGSPNLHGSLIRGGIEESTIPDECVITLERRTLPGESAASVLSEVQAAVARAVRGLDGITATVQVIQHRHPFEIDADHHLVSTLNAAARACGADTQPVGISFWADSALIAETGIPTVLFGPSGEGAHAEVEWVSVSSTVTLTQVLIDTAKSLGSAHEARTE